MASKWSAISSTKKNISLLYTINFTGRRIRDQYKNWISNKSLKLRMHNVLHNSCIIAYEYKLYLDNYKLHWFTLYLSWFSSYIEQNTLERTVTTAIYFIITIIRACIISLSKGHRTGFRRRRKPVNRDWKHFLSFGPWILAVDRIELESNTINHLFRYKDPRDAKQQWLTQRNSVQTTYFKFR